MEFGSTSKKTDTDDTTKCSFSNVLGGNHRRNESGRDPKMPQVYQWFMLMTLKSLLFTMGRMKN